MNPNDLVERLAKIGVNITSRTIFNYAEWQIIPKPERGASRAGKWVDYPDEAILEIYAAWSLIHGEYGNESIHELFAGKPPKIAPDAIAMIRLIYMADRMALEKVAQNSGTYTESPFADAFNRDYSPVDSDKVKRAMALRNNQHSIHFFNGFSVVWQDQMKKAQTLLAQGN
jgi:hypothetical protein